jgi:vitamin B12 transporter
MPLKFTLFLILFAALGRAFAQQNDTARMISGVQVVSDRVSTFSCGLRTESLDSTVLSVRRGTDLASLLAEQSPLSMRSYGPGGIATLSLRGTTASQSGVFWNGINLVQPNMAMTDLSRIRAIEFNNVVLQSGGASALLGSGIIGGSLHLSNTLDFSGKKDIQASLDAGTSGKGTAAIKFGTGNSRLAYTGSLAGGYDQNNFYYTDFSGERKRMQHALVRSFSSVNQAEYILRPGQKLAAGLWYQATAREIPPTMTMASSDQFQDDRALRTSLQWSLTREQQSVNVRLAFVDETEHYRSEKLSIDSRYHVSTWQGQSECKHQFGRTLTLGSGLTARMIRADVPYYGETRYQPEGAGWLALVWSRKPSGFKTLINLRQDWVRGYKIPFCPSLGAELPVNQKISLRSALSRNFRVPSMNDRFWIPGGNPDLKPENSWNADAGITIRFPEWKMIKSEAGLSLYTARITDMIQWLPGEAGIWSPQNADKVWSRGAELTTRTEIRYGKMFAYFLLGYNFSPSTRTDAAGIAPDRKTQLIYMPVHKVSETFYFSHPFGYALITCSLTGKRYVNADNTQSLPAYSLIGIQMGKSFPLGACHLRVQAEIRNLFNTEYQSVLYYPEPGRTFGINLLISK